MTRPFLTACWQNLILANYPMPEPLLRSCLPAGLEPDRHDGSCWCSLVGFQFLDTRVFGVPWPGFRNFPEWNLRCYVRCGNERGVLFIREYVQSRLIAWVARTIYNEPYRAVNMREEVRELPSETSAEYAVSVGNRWHHLRATGSSPADPSEADRWFIDQRWGYGCTKRGKLAKYQVTHPLWQTYRLREATVDIDGEKLYGPEWTFLNEKPANVVFVPGSTVAVFPNATINSTPAVDGG
jgi:uncharacterized protein